MIEAINHVGIRVRDMDAAARFYVDMLGLTANPRKPNWLMLRNGQMLHLMPATEKSDAGRDIGDLARHVALHVASLEAVTALLIEHGYQPFQTKLSAPDDGIPERLRLTGTHDLTFRDRHRVRRGPGRQHRRVHRSSSRHLR